MTLSNRGKAFATGRKMTPVSRYQGEFGQAFRRSLRQVEKSDKVGVEKFVLEFRCHTQLETAPQFGMADFPSLDIAGRLCI